MPVVDSYPRHSPSSFLATGFQQDMSQHYAKPSYYASNNMNVAPPTSGVTMGGMGNHAYSHPAITDAYRFPNVHQQQQQPQQQRPQQEYAKPANPPLKVLVPSEMVGAIIGRGGATIREITKASRARVDVHRNYDAEANAGQQHQQQHAPNGILPALSTNAVNSEKVISIYGKEGESISTACKKILEVMDTEFKKIRQNRLECGVPGFMNGMTMTMAGKPTTMMMTETALKMLAPNALIGRIIGKQGKKVNEIKDKSGAKITVSNVYDINAENPERTIIITGTLDAMSTAESKISEILRICHQQEMNKFPPHGSEGGGYFSPSRYHEHNINNNNNNSIDYNNANSPYSNYLARGGGYQGRGGGGGGSHSHLVGQPAMMGAGLVDVASPNHNNGPPMLPHHHTQMPPPPQFGGPPPMNHENHQAQQPISCMPDPNYDTVFLYVPAASVGAIIGKKGESVRQITRISGAIIKIAAENKEKAEDASLVKSGGVVDPVPPRDASKTPGEKSVAITATYDAQCRAIAQIFKKLFEERFFGNDPPFLALDLLIPSAQMGKVLGKQKLKIRTIERRTGVNIRVPENRAAAIASAEGEDATTTEGASTKDESQPANMTKAEYDDSMSYVTIRGNLTQMIQAMTMVKEILHGELPHGPGFLGPPPVPHMYPPFHRNPYSYPNYRGTRGRARF